jgi:hypothetical protein
MHEPTRIAELRRCLLRHGLPFHRLERVVRETAEHWEDARAVGLEEGLTENEASSRADLLLGDPTALAKSFTSQLRRQSWLGRHPLLAFLLLPTLLVLLAFALSCVPITAIDTIVGFGDRPFLHTPIGLRLVLCFVWTIYVAGTALAPVVLSWWAWRSGLGRRFALVLCVGCAVAAAVRFLQVDLAGRSIAFGFGLPNLNAQTASMILLHLVIAVAFLVLTRRIIRLDLPRPELEPNQAHEN